MLDTIEDLEQLRGCQLPRVGTPRRPDLGSYGPAAAALMDTLGVELLPWQQHALTVGMEVLPNGRYRSQTVAVVVARQNGKTRGLLIPRIAFQLFMEPRTLTVHLSADRAVPRTHFEELVELVTAVPALSRQIKRVRLANGQEELKLKNGSTYTIKAPTGKSNRGPTVHLLVWDETREQRDNEAWSAALYTQRAVPNPQLWTVSNAGDPDSLILNRLRDRGRTAAADPDSDPGMTYLEWSADKKRHVLDTDGWREANPSLGYFLRASAFLEEMNNDDPDTFRTEALCQWVASTASLAVPADRWRACAEGVPPREDGSRPWLGVDIDPEGMRAVLVAVSWHSGRLVAEVLESWDDGLPVSHDVIADRTHDWWRSTRATAIAYDPYTTGAVAERLERRITKRKLAKVTGVDWYTACTQLWDAVQHLILWHGSDDVLTGDVLAAARKEVGDGAWSISRRHSQQSIPAAMALARAVHLAVTPAAVPSIS